MPNPLDSLLKPRLPSSAVGIESDAACVVQLDRARGGFVVKRAASLRLPTDLVRATFDPPNIADPNELARALYDLITGAGLLRQRKWSVCLPEASTRAAILTIEGGPKSRRQTEEVFEGKGGRSLGAACSQKGVARRQ